MSLTDLSPCARRSRICRRWGSATALKTSEVVRLRATGVLYSNMGICQELKKRGVPISTLIASAWKWERECSAGRRHRRVEERGNDGEQDVCAVYDVLMGGG